MEFNSAIEPTLLLEEIPSCADMEKATPYLRHFFEISVLVWFAPAEKTHVDIFH